MCRTKYWRGLSAAGLEVTAATLQVAANNLTWLVNALAETVIGTYTGASGTANQIVFADANIASINNLVNTINGLGTGHPTGANLYRRMRASVADFRPGFAIGAGDGLVAAATNILLGDNSDGYEVFADSSALAVANTMSIGVGVPTCRRGSGPLIFDHFESDHIVTTAGVLTEQREAAVQQERFDAARFEVSIDSIHCGAAFANNDLVLQVYDINDNLLWGHALGAGTDVPANVLGNEQPIVGPMGSPLFVEAAGTGAFTDGPFVVSGWVRRI
jgi:hypothetical protein